MIYKERRQLYYNSLSINKKLVPSTTWEVIEFFSNLTNFYDDIFIYQVPPLRLERRTYSLAYHTIFL